MPPPVRGAGMRNDAIAAQAAAWIVRLSGDDEAGRARARAGFSAWKLADPRHAQAAAGMEELLAQLEEVRGQAGGSARPARAALGSVLATAPPKRARRAVAALGAALALLAGPAWLSANTWRPAWLLADLRAGSGQWRSHTLDDGSRITLNGASAVNLRFDSRRRTVELVQGEILVDVASDAARPFVVETPQGSMRALGTRFTVARQGPATVLSMLESRVAVRSASGGEASVGAGQRVTIDAAGIGAPTPIDPASINDAWRLHQLAVADRPLAEVLAQLQRHRSGRIEFDPATVAGIRVSAVLPLDDSDGALTLLQASFPQLRIRTITPWLVLVEPKKE
ncbi:FecR domain-containing protein [Massilia violaceinigra]|uniref:FecR domain-containing protein n=2 Tax=Massilia violaceinigra TaxID=2045208 RepID=A0ABY4A2C1_9BURK|nr:FecR domain-containing protein [Massilia violaceinigra]